jgi:DnaK suppressor protein
LVLCTRKPQAAFFWLRILPIVDFRLPGRLSACQSSTLRKLSSVDADRARELLAAERRRIEAALKGRSREDDSEPNDYLDSANLSSDLYQDELDEGVAEDLRASLAAVERAEQRLVDGTYGLSIESGEPIPDERLEALPTAERTVEEEQRHRA